MSTPRDSEALAARIDQLEVQNRRLHYGLLTVAAVAGGLSLLAFGPRVPAVVRAERFELVTAAGQRRAVLAADTSAFSVVLYGSKGQPSSGLALSDVVPRIVVLNGAGRVLASLGGPTTYPARP